MCMLVVSGPHVTHVCVCVCWGGSCRTKSLIMNSRDLNFIVKNGWTNHQFWHSNFICKCVFLESHNIITFSSVYGFPWRTPEKGVLPPLLEHLGWQRFHYFVSQLVLFLSRCDVRTSFLKWSVILFTFYFPPVLSSWLGPLEPLWSVISLPIRPFSSPTHFIS